MMRVGGGDERGRSVAGLLGCDIGTSAVKVVLWDEARGAAVVARSAPYAISAPHPGWAEQDPQVWLVGLEDALGQLRAQLGTPTLAVEAMGFAGQMHGVVLTDAAGWPLRPALLWADARATEEAAAVGAAYGAARLAAETGSVPTANYVLPKLLWLLHHEPHVLERAAHVLQPKDWVRTVLGGDPVSEPTDGSGTGWMDLARRAWHPELSFGLPPRLRPPLVAASDVVGRLRADFARRLGLPAGLPLVAGAGDLPAAVLAAGARDASRPVLNVGSAGQVAVVLPAAEPGPDGAQRFCHPDPGLQLSVGALLAAGLAVRWARQLLGDVALPPADEVADVVFIPHLAGERLPSFDLGVRGAWVGLGLETGAGALAGAAAHGVAFAYRELLEWLCPQGWGRPLVLAEGGRSDDWARRLANTLGEAVDLCLLPSPSAMGACQLAALGLGLRRWGGLGLPAVRVVDPAAQAHRRLAALYGVYRALRPVLAAADRARRAEP